MSEIVIYKSSDGALQMDINFADGTLWLSQQHIADLLGTKCQTNELNEKTTSSILEHMAQHGQVYKKNQLLQILQQLPHITRRINKHFKPNKLDENSVCSLLEHTTKDRNALILNSLEKMR